MIKWTLRALIIASAILYGWIELSVPQTFAQVAQSATDEPNADAVQPIVYAVDNIASQIDTNWLIALAMICVTMMFIGYAWIRSQESGRIMATLDNLAMTLKDLAQHPVGAAAVKSAADTADAVGDVLEKRIGGELGESIDDFIDNRIAAALRKMALPHTPTEPNPAMMIPRDIVKDVDAAAFEGTDTA